MPREWLIQHRAGTLAEWEAAEASGPALLAGERAYITDTKTDVVGDGVTKVASLGAVGSGTYVQVTEHPPTPQQYWEAGDTDWTAAFGRLFASGATAAYVPPSATPYDISTGLAMPLGFDSLELAQGATVRATSAISGPILTVYDITTQRRFGKVSGGTWDCNELALDGISVPWHWGFELSDTVIMDHTRDGVLIGSAGSPSGSAQHKLRNVELFRTQFTTLPVGSRGIVIHRATDGTCVACIVQSADTSFWTNAGSNQFYSCHGWNSANGTNGTTFYDDGGNNDYFGCCADSPNTYGWHIKQWNVRIHGGFSLQPTPGNDNLATAIHIDCGGPGFAGVIKDHYFKGGAASRWLKDFDGTVPYPGLQVSGCRTENVTTAALGGLHSFNDRMRVDASGSPTSVPLTLNADNSGTADLFRVLKGGAQKFAIDAYGVGYGVGAFYSDKVRFGDGSAIGSGFMSGTGSPNGVVPGSANDGYIRTDGGAGTWLYRCTGGTAWTAVI